MASKLQDLLSQSWYDCKYVLLGLGRKKQVDEFLEDHKDFIDAVHISPREARIDKPTLKSMIQELARFREALEVALNRLKEFPWHTSDNLEAKRIHDILETALNEGKR